MSQVLQFRKLTVFSEGITQYFSPESIHESLKNLLRGTEKRSTEYVEQFFEPINLNYLRIEVRQLEKIIQSFGDGLKYPIFEPAETTFFMMDQNIWNAIEQIVETRLRSNLEEEQERKGKLRKATGISADYQLLSNLFAEKLLFVNVF